MKVFLPIHLMLFSMGYISNGLGQTNNPPAGTTENQYATIGGQKMRYQEAGNGSVTVVLESGLGDDLSTWNSIFPEVATFAKVIRYDRKGLGLSQHSDPPLSLTQIATNLHDLLGKAGIKPPYILVGHSMGGALIRAFANSYRGETAGFVFIDPFNELIFKTAGDPAIQGKLNQEFHEDSIRMATGPPAIFAEFNLLKNEIKRGFPEINSFGHLPDVPAIILVAGHDRPDKWEKDLIEFYKSKMNSLSETRLIVLPQSPHYIHHYDPSLVIESIRRVVFPDAEKILLKTLKTEGVDSCLAQYKELKAAYPKEYMLERFLNTLGYQVLHAGDAKGAIKLFALNVSIYPASANVYDSLGEAYMAVGDNRNAIKNYERSLALNSANSNATAMLKKLK